ncbi:MAG: hypothetical protein JW990_12915 [Thermoleophilia bacterium]|nr:hypothetical protein [Thermoleophilia bacterium]
MARKKETATITYTGSGVYTYDKGKGVLRPGESATVTVPLADHWQVLLRAGHAGLS